MKTNFKPLKREVEEGEIIPIEGIQYTVKAPCANKTGGHWYCVRCGVGFGGNAFNFAEHINEFIGTDHILVWICHEHGPEVP